MRSATVPSRNNDVEYDFRQDSNFLYMSGVEYNDVWLVVLLDQNYTILLVPERTAFYGLWMGVVETKQQLQEKFDVDAVWWTREWADMTRYNIRAFFVLGSTAVPALSGNYVIDRNTFNSALMSSRTVKTNKEIELMALVSQIGSEAHEYVMKNADKDLAYEFHLASLFEYYSYNCGCRHQAYPPIVAGNNNSAVLHYIDNNRLVRTGGIVLQDAGPEFRGYGTDITRCYVIGGKFDKLQTDIYNVVLKSQESAISLLRAGVRWGDITERAIDAILDGLLTLNLVQGSKTTLRQQNVQNLFFPHGLGHYVGLDVHDTNGLGSGTILSENVVLTIEPGVYFNQMYINSELSSKPNLLQYVNMEKVREYYPIGGVRIEDVLQVTSTGYRALSTAVKEISQIEQLMNSN